MIDVDHALRYPIGAFTYDADVNDAKRRRSIEALRTLPEQLERALVGLEGEALDRPYREGAWSARQLVHHLADGHMNTFIRFKLTITEDNPTVKPFDENTWAVTPDTTGPIQESLDIIKGLHARWVRLLESFAPSDFERTFVHPVRSPQTLDHWLQYMAWHGAHHATQIANIAR
jgi:uncharacterized damage-inducible protein DinB